MGPAYEARVAVHFFLYLYIASKNQRVTNSMVEYLAFNR
jgi:hypothetical protein